MARKMFEKPGDTGREGPISKQTDTGTGGRSKQVGRYMRTQTPLNGAMKRTQTPRTQAGAYKRTQAPNPNKESTGAYMRTQTPRKKSK